MIFFQKMWDFRGSFPKLQKCLEMRRIPDKSAKYSFSENLKSRFSAYFLSLFFFLFFFSSPSLLSISSPIAAHLLLCLAVCLNNYRFSSTCTSIRLSVCLYLPLYLVISLSIHLFLYLPIYLFIEIDRHKGTCTCTNVRKRKHAQTLT